MNPYVADAFYRVSIKALIFDADGRVLVYQDHKGEWEMPGGGIEHDETLEDCVTRELMEEMRVEPAQIGNVQFVYSGPHEKGYYKFFVVVPVTLASTDFAPAEDDLVAARFVGRDEFMQLPFQKNEEAVRNCAGLIWPES